MLIIEIAQLIGDELDIGTISRHVILIITAKRHVARKIL